MQPVFAYTLHPRLASCKNVAKRKPRKAKNAHFGRVLMLFGWHWTIIRTMCRICSGRNMPHGHWSQIDGGKDGKSHFKDRIVLEMAWWIAEECSLWCGGTAITTPYYYRWHYDRWHMRTLCFSNFGLMTNYIKIQIKKSQKLTFPSDYLM